MDDFEMFEQKICGVCGDNALGYNFNAISCEPCKAFFRRNAAKNKQLKCKFQNECNIDIMTRKFCAKCRLDKCFAIGMNKDWILSEEEKRFRNVNINKNKIKRKNTKGKKVPESVRTSSVIVLSTSANPVRFTQKVNLKPQVCASAMPQQPILMASIKPCHVKTSNALSQTVENNLVLTEDNSMYIDLSCHNSNYSQDMPSVSSYICQDNSHQFSDIVLQDNYIPISNNVEMKSCEVNVIGANNIIRNTCPHSTAKEVLEIDPLDECTYLTKLSELKFFHSNEMTTTEVQKINELISTALYVSHIVQTTRKQLFCTKMHDTQSICYKMADNGIRNLIELSKNISAFKNSCEEDQIALVKGSCMDLCILWSVMTYDSVADGWQNVDGTWIKMDKLRKTFKECNYEEYEAIVQSFDSAWREDITLHLILTMIVLLTPKRADILHPDVIEKELYSYYLLLQKYLESKSSCSDATVQFVKLIQTVQDLKNVSKLHLKSLATNKSTCVGPLLTEILDL